MEVSGRLHIPAPLIPGKEPHLPTGWDVDWAPEPSLDAVGNRIPIFKPLAKSQYRMRNNNNKANSYLFFHPFILSTFLQILRSQCCSLWGHNLSSLRYVSQRLIMTSVLQPAHFVFSLIAMMRHERKESRRSLTAGERSYTFLRSEACFLFVYP
jgi:hypothetical protein